MANFMENLEKIIDTHTNVSVTENGAKGFKTTNQPLLDVNFKISSMRNMNENEKIAILRKAYYEDKLLFTKWLFFAGDVRGGCGERDLFKTGLSIILNDKPEAFIALMKLIPEYTRWDNLIKFVNCGNSEVENSIINIIKEQLNEDMENMNAGKSISLLAKWMPSANTSSAETRKCAKKIIEKLQLTDRVYRKLLSSLRKYLDVIEVKMSSKRFNEIDYSAVPSKANVKYNSAFLRNDEERRREFLDKLSSGKASINGSVNFPHDIVHMYYSGSSYYGYKTKPEDVAIEALWKALPDYVKGQGNTICVSDGSGSMTSTVSSSCVTALEIAMALSIYFAEHSSGQFKDKFITFSENPQMVDLSNCKSLHDKINMMVGYTEVSNTNIEKVFDMILHTAVSYHLKQEEIPNILILSDMEFDRCVVKNDNEKLSPYSFYMHNKNEIPSVSDFEVYSQRFKSAGYKLPKVTFWNICSRTGTIPIKENELGCALVSGFSPAIVKMVLSSKTDPWEILMEQLDNERYAPVEEAVAKIF